MKLITQVLLWGASVIGLAAAPSFTVPTSNLRNFDIPIYPISGSIAPYVDKDGYVDPQVNLGNVDFGNGLTLPLVLNFSSALRGPSPEFGQGWECPLFESKVFDVQHDLKRVETLGGKTLYFVYDARHDIWRHYYTDAFTGRVVAGKFELTYKSGCKLIYDKGLITSMTMPNGRTLVWNRSGDKVVSLQETGRAPALEITYDKLGFANRLELNPDSFGKSGSTFSLEASPIYAALSKIHLSNGEIFSFAQGHDKSLNPFIVWGDPSLAVSSLTWDKKTGKIVSDGKYNYSIAEVNPDDTYPRMARTDPKSGLSESYYFDPGHGTTDQSFLDGTQRRTEMIIAPGPNYKEIRLITDAKNGKTREVLRRAFDPDGHLILEAMGLANGKEATRQFVYDQAGRVVSYIWNGKEMWKNIYDSETGRLTARFVDNIGVKLSFDYLPGGEVNQSEISSTGARESSVKLSSTAWKRSLDRMQEAE